MRIFMMLAWLGMVGFQAQAQAAKPKLELGKVKLPPGFRIQVLKEGLEGARSMALSPSGTLFVGTRESDGRVYAIPGALKDAGGRVHTLAQGLNMPNGVAFRGGALYVAEVGRVLRYDGIESRLDSPPKPVVVKGDLPTEKHHGWKFIAFGPDGKLYVPIGAPCNACTSKDERFASIARMNADGSGFEIVARGVRNTVGFDWDPATKALWFTDNGRDMLGDDMPPDELNRLSKAGEHFGFPQCHGNGITDPEFGENHDCKGARYAKPQRELGPHVAALGMRFYDGKMFGPEYQGNVFIAEHGSWNRSKPIGYRVMRVKLEGGKPVSYEPFAEGWLSDGDVWGRPVDVLVAPDGSLLVSDDQAGAIYRISRG